MEHKRRTTVVYTSKVADFLLMKGEELITVRPDLKNPDHNVFVFKSSETMGQHLQEAKEVL